MFFEGYGNSGGNWNFCSRELWFPGMKVSWVEPSPVLKMLLANIMRMCA